jgi:hypothetical protein
MSKIHDTEKALVKKVKTFFSGKPIWVWWIWYIALSAVLFGVLYLAIYILVMTWWVTLIIIILAGIVWGTVAFINKSGS